MKLDNALEFINLPDVDYIAYTVTDFDALPPWIRYDGYGEVRAEFPSYSKKPYERLLPVSDRHAYKLVYDMKATKQKAIKIWGVQAIPGLSLNQYIAQLIEQDFKRLAAYCREEWYYIAVIVQHRESGLIESLHGIESDANEYITEVALELLNELKTSLEKE